MGKRAAAACQVPGILQRPRRRKKETPSDVAPGLGSRSGSGTTQATQIQGGPLKKLPGKRKKPDKQIQGGKKPDNAGGFHSYAFATSQVPLVPTRSLSWAPSARAPPSLALDGGTRRILMRGQWV